MAQRQHPELDTLADHLRQRREHLLTGWRQAIGADPELKTHSSLSRTALEDHIPDILEHFEHRLRAEDGISTAQTGLKDLGIAAGHGLQRWQQGYDFREILSEWGHFQRIVQHELEEYSMAHRELDPQVMLLAREAFVALCIEGMRESATRYVRLQQAEASSRVQDLRKSLTALQVLENERAAILRETAHDLRGSVGVLASASALLIKPDIDQTERSRFYDMLQRRIRSMGALLSELMDLARLEAGEDPVHIEMFDVAERLLELCAALRPLANERNLFLKCEGPRPLRIEGDPLKIQRIAQNLLLNALKATERGGIQVRWFTDTRGGAQQWVLSVADSGRGFDPRSAGTFRRELKNATDEAHAIEAAHQEHIAVPERRRTSAGGQPSQSDISRAWPPAGEGIGLSIVKRLSELLDASVEFDSASGQGTTFRIVFPAHYPEVREPTTAA